MSSTATARRPDSDRAAGQAILADAARATVARSRSTCGRGAREQRIRAWRHAICPPRQRLRNRASGPSRKRGVDERVHSGNVGAWTATLETGSPVARHRLARRTIGGPARRSLLERGGRTLVERVALEVALAHLRIVDEDLGARRPRAPCRSRCPMPSTSTTMPPRAGRSDPAVGRASRQAQRGARRPTCAAKSRPCGSCSIDRSTKPTASTRSIPRRPRSPSIAATRRSSGCPMRSAARTSRASATSSR